VSLANAIVEVLSESIDPLHYQEITTRVLSSGRWTTTGKTPEATVSATLSTNKKLFVAHGGGIYGLRTSPGSLEPIEVPLVSEAVEVRTDSGLKHFTYLEAAEFLLSEDQYKSGLHYRTLTNLAIQRKLIAPEGLTPEATMSAQINSDIQKRLLRGDQPRFARVTRGVFRLVDYTGSSLVNQIDSHNLAIRKQLHKRLHDLDPYQFENVVGLLLQSMGFENVHVTSKAGDSGIDVTGTLVVADVIRTRMAVQVKKWTANIQRPLVQQVRGSLGVHDQGLIITTSGFSSGAREEANKPNATLVALMDGEALVNQLIEYGIGIEKSPVSLLALSDDPIAPPQNEPVP
jgi:restriction system protein